MTVSPFDNQANRVMEALQEASGTSTGPDLDRLMLDLTGGKRYCLTVEFTFDEMEDADIDQTERFYVVNRLLSEHRAGKDVTKELNEAFKSYIKYVLPGYGVAGVTFRGIEHGCPSISIEFHDIVGAYKFACMFDGKKLPEQYGVMDLGKSVTFLYSLWPEFTGNRAAANKLGLVPEPNGNNS